MTLWNTMSATEQNDTLRNMRRFGGGFVGVLAEAWEYADSKNDKRLAEAFPDLIEKYQPKNWS